MVVGMLLTKRLFCGATEATSNKNVVKVAWMTEVKLK